MMAQGYKLRLGDGTTFAVDEKGLHTWLEGRLMDESARIQPQGTTQWLTVRQLQVFEREAAEREIIERRFAERNAEAARKAAEARQAAEERKAADEAAARELLAEQERLAAEQQAAAQRKAAEKEAEAETRAIEERVEEERKAAAQKAALSKKRAVEKKAASDKKAAMEKRAAAEKKAAAERKAAEEKAAREREDAERKAAEERAAREREAAERRAEEERQAQARAEAERKEAEEKAAREREAAERRAEEERQAQARAEADRKAAEEKAAREQEAAERKAEAERKAAEQQAARQREIEEQERALERQAAQARAERERLEAEAQRGRTLAAFDGAEDQGRRETTIGGPEIALGPVAMGIEGDDASPLYEVDSQLKRIPMMPASEGADDDGWREPAAVSEFETRISWLFDRISPFVLQCERWVLSRRRSRPPGASPAPVVTTSASPAMPGPAAQWVSLPKAWAARASAAVPPMIAAVRGSLSRLPRLKWPRSSVSAPAEPGLSPSEAAVWPPSVEQREKPVPIPEAAPESRPEPIRLAELAEPVFTAPPVQARSSPAARPPQPVSDVPVIKLAELNEPKPETDEFDDGPMSGVSDGLATGFAWVKSVTVTAILLVVIYLLVTNYKAWFPQAMATTMRLFAGMDDLKARYAPPQASREALQAATEQLPQLTQPTIETVMARSGSSAPQPTEVFRRAAEAAAKGKAALAPTASGELDSHMAALLGTLNEGEAERLRRYMDRVAAGEAMLPYEDNEAMWLTARGARRLPAERLTRIQQLNAQAITIGLGPKPAPEEPSLPSLPPLPSLPAFEGPSR
jgi:hypothetical protein